MEYLTCKELGDKYGVSRQAVFNMAKKGVIKHVVSDSGVLLFEPDAEVPAAWYYGEKGRTAQAKRGVSDGLK